MLESLMVFPNDNHNFFNLPQHFDDGMAKLMQQQEQQLETFIASASASPIQDYLLAPVPLQPATHHQRPQTQPQSQPHSSPSYSSHSLDQSAMAFSNHSMPQLISSAPASPSYPIVKTENSEEQHFQRLRQHQSQQQPQQQQQVDFLMYPPFEMQGPTSPTQQQQQQQQHVVASQISSPIAMTTTSSNTQARLAPSYSDVNLFHQRQQHQQQQQRHAQQLRLQHQQQQQQQQQFSQQLSSNMMIPVTTAALSAMLDAVCSAPVSSMPLMQPVDSEHFVPVTTTTSMPLFESTQDSFQRQPGFMSTKAHPASPSARKEPVRHASPTLTDTIPSPTMPVAIVPNMSASSSPAPATLVAPLSPPTPLLTPLNKVKSSRTTRITKSIPAPSSPSSLLAETTTTTAAMSRAAKAASTRAAKRATAATAALTDATTSTTTTTTTTAAAAIPVAPAPTVVAPAASVVYQHLPGSHGNVTHPRRAAQNRAAQRTFRNRRKAYIKDLESKVQLLDNTKKENEQLATENQLLLQHAQQLEQMLSEAGFRLHPGMSSLMDMDLSLTIKLSKKESEEDSHNDMEQHMDAEELCEQEHRPLTESNIQRLDIQPSL